MCPWIPLPLLTDFRTLLRDAEIDLILTDSRHVVAAVLLASGSLELINIDLPEGMTSFANGRVEGSAPVRDDLAYLLYTSGSTGKPKGVLQNHRNVLHFIRVYTGRLHVALETGSPVFPRSPLTLRSWISLGPLQRRHTLPIQRASGWKVFTLSTNG